jgi:putative chitinase
MVLTQFSLVSVNIKASIQHTILTVFNDNCNNYKVNTALRIAHFMAQLCHESSGFNILEENMNYTSPSRLMDIWPRRFPTIEKANEYLQAPEKLGNYVYANRMGNGDLSTGDGYRYRGRGPLQTTGKDAYKDISLKLFNDLRLLEQPGILKDLGYGLKAAFIEWAEGNCNVMADNDDLVKITRKINGGLIGLEGRRTWLVKWKKALAINATTPLDIIN